MSFPKPSSGCLTLYPPALLGHQTERTEMSGLAAGFFQGQEKDRAGRGGMVWVAGAREKYHPRHPR